MPAGPSTLLYPRALRAEWPAIQGSGSAARRGDASGIARRLRGGFGLAPERRPGARLRAGRRHSPRGGIVGRTAPSLPAGQCDYHIE